MGWQTSQPDWAHQKRTDRQSITHTQHPAGIVRKEGTTDLDAEVPGADDVLDLARDEHGLELGGQVGRTVRDVQIPQREDQHHRIGDREEEWIRITQSALPSSYAR